MNKTDIPYVQQDAIIYSEPRQTEICGIYKNCMPLPGVPFSYIYIDGVFLYPSVEYGGFYTPVVLETPNPFNPDLKVIKSEGFKIIREDLLPGGTKQRALYRFLENKTKVVYAGPCSGIAQVAMGVIGKSLNIETIMFGAGKPTKLTEKAISYGVKQMPVSSSLREAKIKAGEYIEANGGELLPFGLDDPDFINLLSSSLIAAKKKLNPKRMWVVAGSGVLLRTLYNVFPQTYFLAVQVGRKINYSNIRPERTQVFVHPLKFNEIPDDLPPYPTVPNYDGKLWFFVKKYGLKGDYVWNTAC